MYLSGQSHLELPKYAPKSTATDHEKDIFFYNFQSCPDTTLKI